MKDYKDMSIEELDEEINYLQFYIEGLEYEEPRRWEEEKEGLLNKLHRLLTVWSLRRVELHHKKDITDEQVIYLQETKHLENLDVEDIIKQYFYDNTDSIEELDIDDLTEEELYADYHRALDEQLMTNEEWVEQLEEEFRQLELEKQEYEDFLSEYDKIDWGR